MNIPRLTKIAFIGNYPPRKCGIATFTYDLRRCVSNATTANCFVVAINNISEGHDYEKEVQARIAEQEIEDYRNAADYLNLNNVDIVSLQHEFGIYGGPSGSHILALLRDLRMPVVTTLHTVLSNPNSLQRAILSEIAGLSTRLVVMTERSKRTLESTYGIPSERIDLIAHGIPKLPDTPQHILKQQFNVQGKPVALTFGLLSPGKGIEFVLRAIPEIIKKFPDFIYLVLGATHPTLLREQGERYRINLERLAIETGIQKHVSFYNRFVSIDELTDFIGSADLYITPYLNEEQAVSGTLAYAFGSGQAVISTPYWHAEELLANGRGVLVPFGDSAAIGNAVIELLGDDARRNQMRKNAQSLGQKMTWDHVSESYLDSFLQSREQRRSSHNHTWVVRTLDEQPLALPLLQLSHLKNLSDSTGIVQHAIYSVPDHTHGYCTDDNARALILSILLEENGYDPQIVLPLASRYAAFTNGAFNVSNGRFRNFMSFDRKWLEEEGSEDCQGRALWAIGTCVGRSRQAGLNAWARGLFHRALQACQSTQSPRAWAFAILGIHEYLRRCSGDAQAIETSQVLVDRLLNLYAATATDSWPWFESNATYENARIPQALISHGRWSGNAQALNLGLQSLRWLSEHQRSPTQRFRPIGSNGFSCEGQNATFDQQPIEAYGMVAASIEAYAACGDPYWNEQAHLAFDWFLGRNDIGQPVHDAASGGCFDGLMADRLNENQGAESTLSYLLSLVAMRSLGATMRATSSPRQSPP
jgi:glycosyltransferase involved in cell wall biosynthesis